MSKIDLYDNDFEKFVFTKALPVYYNGEILMSIVEDGAEYFTYYDTEHLQRWIDEIKPYLDTELDAVVLKYALSYTLQSLRNNENMDRFKWGDECV